LVLQQALLCLKAEKVHPGNARQQSMLANLQQQLHPKTALQQGYG
jgi:hypothetical protein